ncbi:MAG: hypothetical protein NC039_03695 [Muribaculaceae bacterium]|nr:hypothetical protein [Muribaculaceae bacterium]
MKKFYSSLALAAAVCFSASAADSNVEKIKNVTFADAVAAAPAATKAATKAPQKAFPTTIDELCGLFNNAYHTTVSGGWDNAFGTVSIVPGDKPSTVYILGLSDAAIEGEVDFRGATISCPASISLGDNYNFGDPYGVQEIILTHCVPAGDGSNGLVDSTEPFLFYFYDDGTIESAPDEYYMARVPGIGPNSSAVGMSMTAIKLTRETVSNEGWSKVGTATYYDDGFVIDMWSWTNGTPAIECDVYTNAEKPNVYRLYTPYGTLNELTGETLNAAGNQPGYIDLDCTDPSCVLVPKSFTGFVEFDYGPFLAANTEWVSVDGGTSVSEVKQVLGADNVSTFNAETRLVMVKNCLVGAAFNNYTPSLITDVFTWKDPSAAPSCTFTAELSESCFTGSGIADVIATEEAPVEYYNLQGIRVNNPDKGVYIRVQGKNAVKVVR